MTLDEALEHLERAEHYIASLRDQIDRERRQMRDQYGAENAMLRAENERLYRKIAAMSAITLPQITIKTPPCD